MSEPDAAVVARWMAGVGRPVQAHAVAARFGDTVAAAALRDLETTGVIETVWVEPPADAPASAGDQPRLYYRLATRAATNLAPPGPADAATAPRRLRTVSPVAIAVAIVVLVALAATVVIVARGSGVFVLAPLAAMAIATFLWLRSR